MKASATCIRCVILLAGFAVLLATPVWAQPLRAAAAKAGTDKLPASPERVDVGDFYWHDGRRVGLLRSNSEVSVGFRADLPRTHIDPIVSGLPRVDSRRARRAGRARGGEELWVLPLQVGALTSDIETTLAAARARPEVEYAHPVLYHAETRTRLLLTDDVVLKMKPGVTLSDLAAVMRSSGLVVRSGIPDTPDEFILRLEQPRLASALSAAQDLHESRLVVWAQPDFVQAYRRSFIPNDPRFPNQWHLRNTGQRGATVDADVDAEEAWDVSVGSPSILIAVIDDGVETNHEDLAPNMYANPAEPVNGIDDDLNGYVDDYRGWDFFDNDNNPNPVLFDDDHGTAVAGVAAARGNNAVGVTGSCPRCRILPVRIGVGTSPDSAIASAIRYAARKADVVNMSWGGGAPAAVMHSAIQFAVTSGRAGKGSVVLSVTGDHASGLVHRRIDGIPPGRHRFRWEYGKDELFSSGSDTAWLAWVVLPDAELVTFQDGLPAGWRTGSSFGGRPWSVVTDPIHADESMCLTRALKAGAIPDDGYSFVEVVWTVPVKSTLHDFRWVSSQRFNDGLAVGVDFGNDGSYDHVSDLESGEPEVMTDVFYPAAFPETLAVAATTDMDCRSYYSPYGPQVAFAASSNGNPINNYVETTDRSGSAGYDPTSNYDSYFGGTSSATPLAAGIAGLVLSVSPNLTASQVRSMLQRSTDKVGPGLYVNGRNNRYGYGRINAFKAVTNAADWIFADGFQ